MSQKRLCAWCGIRTVAEARDRSGDYHRHRTKYCDHCRPLARQALNNRRKQQKRACARLAAAANVWIMDPCSEERVNVRGRAARLTRLGWDYLKLKRHGIRVNPTVEPLSARTKFEPNLE